jgi:DNA-binding PadR family transcriptional regulator
MKRELVAASAEPLVLALLAQGESYGYAIIQTIRERSANEIAWADGMLYPVLHRLQQNRWIKARWVETENGRKRKYYAITARGREALAAHRRDWQTVNATLTALWSGQHV